VPIVHRLVCLLVIKMTNLSILQMVSLQEGTGVFGKTKEFSLCICILGEASSTKEAD